MTEPMDPRAALLAVIEEMAQPYDGVSLSPADSLAVLGMAFMRGAASMAYEPEWTMAILQAAHEAELARRGRIAVSDAEMAHTPARDYPIAVTSR